MTSDKRNFYILGALVLAFILIILLLKIPQHQGNSYREKFTPEEIQKLSSQEKIQLERNVADIENSTRLTLAQIIGGLALLTGLYFTYLNVRASQDNAKTAQENLRVTEEGKLTERFSKAVELLGSEKLDIRLGGIYALERIARDSKKDHWTVVEILTAFVRENVPNEFVSQSLPENTDGSATREDIQAILTVIGRRQWTINEEHYPDLSRVNLNNYKLTNINLSKINLYKTNLSEADLRYANLNGAYLQRANLSKAILREADLSCAILGEADLSYANCRKANLSKADLFNANLSGADLRDANFNITEYEKTYTTSLDIFAGGMPVANTEINTMLNLNPVLSAKNLEDAKFSPEVEKLIKEYQGKQVKE